MASFLTNFHFIRPWWLLALPLGLLLLSGLKRRDAGISQWHKVCDQHLLEQLLVGEGRSGRKRVYGALLTMLLLVTLALAGPTWERLPQPLFRAAEGRVIVLDLSLSMMAEDISPSRLTRARYRAIDLIKSGAGIEQGLIVFAGDAFIVTPLTDDRATLLNLLPSLNTTTIPVQGSRADRGLKKAGELLKRALIKQGQIILICDDADPQTVTMAETIKRAGHRIDVIAVGTASGAPIALPAGGYLKDNRGQIVVPVPNFSLLKKVATNGGGYLTIDAPESAFQRLNQFPTHFPENRENSKVTGDQWLDRGPWLLIPLLLLAALSFRRGWLMLIFMALLLTPEKASAFSWQDLWQRPAQQAAEAFKTEDYDQAAALSQDPDWQAAALYRAGKFKEAAAALKPQTSSLSHYNRGNALARSGDLKEALAAYEKALALDPSLEDARFNRDLVKKLLQKQEQQKKKQQQQQNSDDQKQSKEQKQNQAQDSDKEQQSDSQKSDSKKSSDSNPDSKAQNSPADNQAQNRPDKEDKTSKEQPENQKSETKTTEKKKNEEKSETQTAADKKPKPAEEPDKKAAAAPEANDKPLDAEQQALKQWLRRIPDDPGGLLQRKFLYQYRDRKDRSQGFKEW